MEVDFGSAATDYAVHRPGFPPEFFAHVERLGIGVAGQSVVDLGTGTGTLATGFAERGCSVVGIDVSAPMLAEAGRISAQAGLVVRWVQEPAEATSLPGDAFDVVCAGQCWHWFDRARAAGEALRLLRPGGRILVAYFSYLPLPGTMAAATEDLVLRHHPTWRWAGHDGRHPAFAQGLVDAGFVHASTFEFDLPIRFTHESWRGRIRACNGVIALPPASIGAFDADLARLLRERFPEPLVVQHRVFAIVAEKPANQL